MSPKGTKPEPTAFTKHIHAELRAAAARKSWSMRRLSEEAGLSRQRVHRTVSSDQVALDTNELDALCAALGVAPLAIVKAATLALKAEQAHDQSQALPGIDFYNALARSGYGLAAKRGEIISDEGFEA